MTRPFEFTLQAADACWQPENAAHAAAAAIALFVLDVCDHGFGYCLVCPLSVFLVFLRVQVLKRIA